MHSSVLFVISTFMCGISFIEPMSLGLRGRSGRVARSPWTDWFPHRGDRAVTATASSTSPTSQHVFAAIVFGRGHVITFDGRYYNYPSESSSASCPHILARDHQQYRFILLQNRQSITVYTSNSVLTLHQNNKAEVNNTGSYRDLPVHSGDGQLSVTHDNQNVVLRTGLGIVVDCDISHEECVFQLNSDLHNHTMGLLGTNDDDPGNDFILRSGQEAGSVQELVNYYELTGVSSCRPQAPGSDRPTCTVAHLASRCHELFGTTSSPLAPCFGVVSPQPYQEACQYDIESCDISNKGEAICGTARAYVKMCKTRGVQIHPTEVCVKCDQQKFGASWTEQTHKKLDVIVATTLNSNLMPSNSSLGGMLRNVFHRLDDQLRRQARIQNVRVGVLGFGGQGPLERPHVYTFQGEPFTRHYNAAIWNQVLDSLTLDGTTDPNPYLALRTVLHYPFRTDAVKVVFLLLGQEESLVSQAEVDSVKSLLASRGVFVNVVTRGSAPAESQGGMDVISSGQVLVNTPQPTQQPSNPSSGQLGQIVQATGGAVFDLDQVVASNPQAIHHLGNELRQQVYSQLHICRNCACGRGPDYRGRTTCSTCV